MRKPTNSELLARHHHMSQSMDLEAVFDSLADCEKDDAAQLAEKMQKALEGFGDYVVGLDVGFRHTTYRTRGQKIVNYAGLNTDFPFTNTECEFGVYPCYIGIVVEAPGRTWHLANFESGEITVLLRDPKTKYDPVPISLRSVVCRSILDKEDLLDLVNRIKYAVSICVPEEPKK